MTHSNLICIAILAAVLGSSCGQNSSDYRLSKNHIPKNYTLNILVDPNLNEFRGEVIITFATQNASNSIQVHASPTYLTIERVELNQFDSCNVTNVDIETEIVNIKCSKPIERSENNSIQIIFSGDYKKKNFYGLYKSQYVYNKKTEYFVATQFEPIYARRAFPCFDEPQLKAEFELTIAHPINYTALSNTNARTKTVTDKLMITKFNKTPVMSTYLLAFGVGNFFGRHANRSETGSFPVSVYYKPDASENTTTAIKYGGALIDTHGNFTGIAYDELGNPKMDFLGLPISQGAMENWGLITFEEDMLLDRGNETSAKDRQYIVTIMSHELSHQWFGDYVTFEWWSSVWLNEGFATFFQQNFDERFIHLNMETKRQFVVNTLQNILQEDDSESSPLSDEENDIFTSDDIEMKFDELTYDKGGSIIRMMSGILGMDNFQRGIHKYLKENAHKNTNPTILLNALATFYNSSNYRFQELMHNWIYKTGFPAVNVSLNADKKSVQIHQEDFYIRTDEDSVKWHIPISYTTSSQKNFNVNITDWLFDKPLNINVEANSWIIFNLQQIGFFRVNYDTELWYRIIAALKSSNMSDIHVTNRAQLLDDVFSMAERKNVGYHIAFELAEYIKRETEYEPWYVLMRHINILLWKTDDEKQRKAIRNLTLSWINEAFPADKPANLTTHLQELTHEFIIEFRHYLEDEDYLQQAQVIYKQYISTKYIDYHARRRISLCYGLKLSSTQKTDITVLLNSYEEMVSSSARKDILAALGCASDPELLKTYLSELLSDNSRIALHDVNDVLKAVYLNYENGLDVYFQFLNENLRELKEKYDDLKISDLILKPAKRIVTYKQLSKLREILEKFKDINGLDGIAKGLKIHAERIRRQHLNNRDIFKVLNKM